MCITIPRKVTATIPELKVLVNDKEEKVDFSLVDVKEGDFVIIQNNVIISTVPQDEARYLLKLLKGGKNERCK
jgi:hydrogenase maturation factor